MPVLVQVAVAYDVQFPMWFARQNMLLDGVFSGMFIHVVDHGVLSTFQVESSLSNYIFA